MKNTLYMVIPCYNEQEVLPETAKRLRKKYHNLISSGKISGDSRIVFVNDGSKDRTAEMIRAMHESDPMFSGVLLSRNRGHQNALLAGLMTVRSMADMVISMDADLQDDIDAIDRMVDKYLEGCDIVYGVRSARDTDTAFKRSTAESYYKIIESMGGEVVFNHADFRLMSRRALEALSEFGEHNLFLRGLIPMLGFKTDIVYYSRGERFAGESKYPLKKMLALAAEGITSLSIKPIRIVTGTGFFLLLAAFLLFAFSLVGVFMGYTMLNWKIISIIVLLVGGVITAALGVVGEYVGKTYMEVKGRPRYIIESVLHTAPPAGGADSDPERT